MGVDETSKATTKINGLRFTSPRIDGHPPPGSIPLIDDFSLTLRAGHRFRPGHRCLLVGSNGTDIGWEAHGGTPIWYAYLEDRLFMTPR